MLATHIYFNGQCKQAIELYKKVFHATVKTLIENPDHSLVVHAEIIIHDELLMLNDFGNDDGISTSGGYQLSVQFDNEAALQEAYAAIEDGSTPLKP
ncbi:VOC family protein [Enterococcus larvae]|uniref:VOC family protein n=1 Tax=Enterococcus larvae TaxID=2794352 RepID=UPI003F2D985A